MSNLKNHKKFNLNTLKLKQKLKIQEPSPKNNPQYKIKNGKNQLKTLQINLKLIHKFFYITETFIRFLLLFWTRQLR